MDANDPSGSTTEVDPGAYIGHEPEREADTIPGGVSGRDERVSANDSRPGLPGEPEETDDHIQDPIDQSPMSAPADDGAVDRNTLPAEDVEDPKLR